MSRCVRRDRVKRAVLFRLRSGTALKAQVAVEPGLDAPAISERSASCDTNELVRINGLRRTPRSQSWAPWSWQQSGWRSISRSVWPDDIRATRRIARLSPSFLTVVPAFVRSCRLTDITQPPDSNGPSSYGDRELPDVLHSIGFSGTTPFTAAFTADRPNPSRYRRQSRLERESQKAGRGTAVCSRSEPQNERQGSPPQRLWRKGSGRPRRAVTTPRQMYQAEQTPSVDKRSFGRRKSALPIVEAQATAF